MGFDADPSEGFSLEPTSSKWEFGHNKFQFFTFYKYMYVFIMFIYIFLFNVHQFVENMLISICGYNLYLFSTTKNVFG